MDKYWFGYDCYRKLKKYNANFFDLFKIRDLFCLKIYRKANYFHNKKRKILSFIYKVKLQKLMNKYNFNISANSNIGYGLYLGHNGTIIVNHEAKIGNNCNIGVGVTIGMENRGTRVGCPVIGNNVWIGTNAVIVGKITIGDNVLIAPNAFVNFSVPSNSIVIGNPGKIFAKENAVENYINNEVFINEK